MTGGVARYVSLFMDAHAFTRKRMIDLFFSDASPFLEEGRSILMQEFGNDSATYFTILSSIAAGHTKFAEEERYTTIGGWWDRKGENEIDLVCEDDLAGKIDFFEIKRDKGRYRSDLLARKVEAFLEKNPHKQKFTRSVGLLSLEDM